MTITWTQIFPLLGGLEVDCRLQKVGAGRNYSTLCKGDLLPFPYLASFEKYRTVHYYWFLFFNHSFESNLKEIPVGENLTGLFVCLFCF